MKLYFLCVVICCGWASVWAYDGHSLTEDNVPQLTWNGHYGIKPVTEPSSEDMADFVVNEIIMLTAILDKSYPCAVSCLKQTFMEIMNDLRDPAVPSPNRFSTGPNSQVQLSEGTGDFARISICSAYQRGKNCLNACPDGPLKIVLEAESELLADVCTERFEPLWRNASCIEQSLANTNINDQCRAKLVCPTDIPSNLEHHFLRRANFDLPSFTITLEALCQFMSPGGCIDCLRDGLIQHGCDRNVVGLAREAFTSLLRSGTKLLEKAGVKEEDIPRGCQRFIETSSTVSPAARVPALMIFGAVAMISMSF